MRETWLIAWSVLIEAVRRKEIYVIVLAATLLVGAVMTVDFFSLQGVTKFYLEIALQVMSVAAGLTVVVLAARQLPREFQTRTIYPLLAKPISRLTFLNGKLLGVMLAAGFTMALLMGVYIVGSFYLGAPPPIYKLLQYFTMQMFALLVLATLAFMLSLMMNLDAAITIGVLIYGASALITNILSMPDIYYNTSWMGQKLILVLNYIVPQLTLLDLSERAVHGWDPLGLAILAQLVAYAIVFAAIYYAVAYQLFRRRPL